MAQQSTFNIKSLTEVIEKEKEFEKLRSTIKEYDVVEKFKYIFPELSKIAEAVKLEKKTLFLRVENSVWKSELNFQKNALIEKINNHFNEQVIKAIKFL